MMVWSSEIKMNRWSSFEKLNENKTLLRNAYRFAPVGCLSDMLFYWFFGHKLAFELFFQIYTIQYIDFLSS